MLHAYVARFDVMENIEKFCKFFCELNKALGVVLGQEIDPLFGNTTNGESVLFLDM